MKLDNELRKKVFIAQRNEITEHLVYDKISRLSWNGHNKSILKKISEDELKHYNIWKKLTKEDVSPYRLKIFFYLLVIRLFGLTFGLKLMERGEKRAQLSYKGIYKTIPSASKIIKDEYMHEKKLIDLLQEDKLKYMGSIVLGLNDAIIELTGVFVGLTLVLQSTRLIAVTGSITGIAASLSMAASEYLSTRSEKSDKNPLKSSFYTGLAYLFVVIILALPYVILTNVYFSMMIMIINAVIIILIFTYYLSIAQDLPFKKRFTEMLLISFGIALLTFIVGYAVRIFFKIGV